MYRIDSANTAAVLPTPSALGTESYFEDRDAKAGDGATLDADWLNMVMLTLLDVLDDQSISHSKTDYAQLTAALASKIADEAPAEDAGTTSTPGTVEMATDVECRTMTDAALGLSPSNLGSTQMGAGSGVSGWAHLFGNPNYDRYVVQAVTQSVSSGNQYFYWPISFAGSSYSVTLGGGMVNLYWSSRSQTRVNINSGTSGTASVIAMGPIYLP